MAPSSFAFQCEPSPGTDEARSSAVQALPSTSTSVLFCCELSECDTAFSCKPCQQSISVISFQQVAGRVSLICFGFLRSMWYIVRTMQSTWPNRQFHFSSAKRRSLQVSPSQNSSPNCIPHSTDNLVPFLISLPPRVV